MVRQQEVSVFITGSSDSEALFQLILTGLRESGVVRGWLIHVYDYPVSTSFFLEQCHNTDIIILDATIEDDGSHNYCVAPRMYMDHVLSVSRTYLPINYGGIRSGGVPKYPDKLSNKEIANWVIEQVRELAAAEPRKIGKYTALEFMRAQQEGFRLYLERIKASANEFVSYRSSGVSTLQKLIEERHGIATSLAGDSRHLFWFQPGELVFEDELLTPYRRWQVFFYIEPYISHAKRFLILSSPDYLKSWWTVGELIILAYNNYTSRSLPQIVVVDPDTWHETPLEPDSLPEFNRGTFLRFNRYQKASDEHETIPEFQKTARLIRNIPFLNRWSLIKEAFWDDSFYDYAIVPCRNCAGKPQNQFQMSTKSLIESVRQINVDSFFDMRLSGLFQLSLPEIDYCLANNRPIKCPHCGAYMRFREEPNPRYLWLPTGDDDMPGLGGSHLKQLPVYRTVS
ncbi:MAG TPA: hypothetical protein VGB02_13220 [Pyrinomonadaceae bacterium]|jgi:hypothetical protein